MAKCHFPCEGKGSATSPGGSSGTFGAEAVTSALIKKHSERFFLERFVEAAGLALDIIEERETPDFLVCVEDRVVGVEVTRLFVAHDTNGPLPQAQESISDGITRTARRLYESKGGSPAHVSIYFSHRDLRRVDRSQLAASLATFVLDLALVAGKRSDWRWGLGDRILDEHIGFLHTLGVPDRKMAHWSVARAGWVAPVTADVLQERIDKKAQRLAEYQATCVFHGSRSPIPRDAGRPIHVIPVTRRSEATQG